MFLGRGVDSPSFASFSPSYKQALSKANFYNDKLGNMGSQDKPSNSRHTKKCQSIN
jgi:hypothetical protein